MHRRSLPWPSALLCTRTCSWAHTSTIVTIQEIEGSHPKPWRCPATAAPDNISNGKLERSPAGIHTGSPTRAAGPCVSTCPRSTKKVRTKTHGGKKTEVDDLLLRKRTDREMFKGGGGAADWARSLVTVASLSCPAQGNSLLRQLFR